MNHSNSHVPDRVTTFWSWIISAVVSWFIIISSGYILYKVFYSTFLNGFSLGSSFTFLLTLIGVWLIFGNRQHALATLGHDGGHGCVAQNLLLNDLCTNIFTFYPFGVSIERFRIFHFTHHNNLGTSKDTELILKKMVTPVHDLPMVGKQALWRLIIRDLLGLSYKEIFEFLFIFTTPKTFKQARGVLIWWIVFVGCILYYKFYFVFFFVLFWFICLGTSFWAFFRLRTLTEHTGTASVHRFKPTFLQKIILFPYNVWCHYEHHVYPSVAAPKLSGIRVTLDKDVKAVSLYDLYESYKHMPHIPSGAPLAERL